MDIHKAISTHRGGGWGQDDIAPREVCVQSDSIFLNTMHNNLHYGKIVQIPAWFGPNPICTWGGIVDHDASSVWGHGGAVTVGRV